MTTQAKKTARRSAGADLSNDLYDQPGHLLRRAQQIAVSLFFDEISEDITPIQYAVLRTIMEHPGVDQVTIAGLVAIDTSTAATVAIRLEEKGLLSRDIDPGNRRQRQLHLTRQGEHLLESLIPAVHRLHQRILEPFSDAESRQFMKLLAKLVHVNNDHSRAPLTVKSSAVPATKTARKAASK